MSTSFSKGKKHDFKLYKESSIRLNSNTLLTLDKGYQGIKKYHNNAELPKKNTKKKPISKEDKLLNKEINSKRVIVEHIFGKLKLFKILSYPYRNRRKRFSIRFNSIFKVTLPEATIVPNMPTGVLPEPFIVIPLEGFS